MDITYDLKMFEAISLQGIKVSTSILVYNFSINTMYMLPIGVKNLSSCSIRPEIEINQETNKKYAVL